MSVIGRPVGLGASISHAVGEAGSLGIMVRSFASNSDLFFLSASHVVAPPGAKVGDAVIQPAVSHGGSVPIGALIDFELLDPDEENTYDAGLVRIIDPEDVQPVLGQIGEVDDQLMVPKKFASVRKHGAATGPTLGVITNPTATARFTFNGDEFTFANVIEVCGCGSEFSAGGDSGALVVDALTQRPVGLIIGGVGRKTYLSPLARVLHRFKCRLLMSGEGSLT